VEAARSLASLLVAGCIERSLRGTREKQSLIVTWQNCLSGIVYTVERHIPMNRHSGHLASRDPRNGIGGSEEMGSARIFATLPQFSCDWRRRNPPEIGGKRANKVSTTFRDGGLWVGIKLLEDALRVRRGSRQPWTPPPLRFQRVAIQRAAALVSGRDS
jgi:hypothetical protein